MSKAIEFREFFPHLPSHNVMFMLEAMTYKVKLCIMEASTVADPTGLQVEAWTNQYDQESSEGDWHAVALPYIGKQDGLHQYGKSTIITSNHYFQYTFRLRLPLVSSDWTWSHGFGVNGCVEVQLPREYDAWTQGPNYDHILESVYCGNFLAATSAKKLRFTHVLNTADNLDMVYEEGGEVVYRWACNAYIHFIIHLATAECDTAL